jgi:pimeloyl-ACP methyl ester carboxylesterase
VLAADLVGPGPAELPAALAAWLLAPRLDAGGLADMATTIEAEDGFDLARCARPIAAPTLIVAGARDRFYGRDLFEETARLIPAGRLLLLEDRGHVTALTDRRYTAQALTFLDGAAP